MRKRYCLFAIAIVLGQVACTDVEQRGFTALAREMNPIIERLRGSAQGVLRAPPSDVAAISQHCVKSLPALRELSYMSALHRVEIRKVTRIDREADMIRFNRFVLCPEAEVCADLCMQSWAALNDEVERIRSSARKHGVEILSLLP